MTPISNAPRLSRLEWLATPEVRARVDSLPSSNASLLMRDIEAADIGVQRAEAELRKAMAVRAEKLIQLEQDLRECWTARELRAAKIKIDAQ